MATNTILRTRVTAHFSESPAYSISNLSNTASDADIRQSARSICMLRAPIPLFFTKTVEMEVEK